MGTVSINGITKSYGGKPVLRDISITLNGGSFTALLGPSGCGKTTLLRIVAGLETADKGEIIQDDRVLMSGSVHIPPERRGFGMVFQQYAVWPHMTVFENVEYPLRMRRMDKKIRADKTRNALELVHIEELSGRFPHQLSGGQQQRVALARGLVMEPPLLLLDEPLSNLDARLRATMRREIRDLHRRLDISILYVTHDQREAFDMATEIVVMSDGDIEQRGTPREIRENPREGFVKDFLEQ